MKISLNHQLKYTYSRSIILGPHIIGLRPVPYCRTPIESYKLKISPSEHYLTWLQDVYGNYLAKVNFPHKTHYLKVEVDIIAQLQPINPFNFLLEDYAVNYPFTYPPELAKQLIPFLEITEESNLLQAWVENHRKQDIYTTNFILELNQQLAQEINYQIRLEEGIQTGEETLTKKIGSCRDTAWLFVQILRSYGIAARFVSGYLIQLAPDILPLEDPKAPEMDRGDLHAWTEVFLPGAGWIGLDPTSGFLAAEGHIPLVCTPEPVGASPVRGTTEPCESQLDFSVTVSRYQETPRVTKPYTEMQWEKINSLGKTVETSLQHLEVGLTMGGEPTFVSLNDYEHPQWRFEAMGDEKRKLAGNLLLALQGKLTQNGSLLHYGIGKLYPGETVPRWALGCYWRRDGVSIWGDRSFLAEDGKNYGYTPENGRVFLEHLVKYLGVNPDCIVTAYEKGIEAIAGYVLPLLTVSHNEELCWSSCNWSFPDNKLYSKERVDQDLDKGLKPLVSSHNSNILSCLLYLLPGDAEIGLRLPLDTIDWGELVQEAYATINHPPIRASETLHLSPPNSIRIALTVEAKQGSIHLFIPPFSNVRSFLDLISAIENTATELRIPVVVGGYPPPVNSGIEGFQITPDPGVIEVNIHPASNWDELVKINNTLYETARECGLGTEKYLLDGRPVSTGGGAHITLGGKTPGESPILRRPDLLRSLISYVQNHPSLSYAFSGLFVGPTSQSPRLDEGKHDCLSELEIAFQYLKPGTPPEVVDCLLRNLLVDVTGNSHRTEFCIDKLFPGKNPAKQLGLLELRGFAMSPHPQMALLQMLLIRALVAWFWEKPYTHPLIRWGARKRDKFMLPYYLQEDLRGVVRDLEGVGYSFELEWFEPFFAFRFPYLGEIHRNGVHLELIIAAEPWPVLGEEITSGGTFRTVDNSTERIQVRLRGSSERYVVMCNQRQVPLNPTGIVGEYVGAVRFQARQRFEGINHPAFTAQSEIFLEIVDTWSEKSLGGCTYYVNPPNGSVYQQFPVNRREAESRMVERFVPMGHTPGKITLTGLYFHSEYPLTLDLRWLDQ